MNQPPPDDAEPGDILVPRWVQVPVGIVLGLFGLICAAGSATLLISPPVKNPALGVVLGIVLLLGCLWVLEKCIRLITGRKNNGGLMAPRALRVLALLFLVLPLGGLFTGYFVTHTFVAIAQSVAYIAIFFALRRLATEREKHGA